jgi:hypothetical protein
MIAAWARYRTHNNGLPQILLAIPAEQTHDVEIKQLASSVTVAVRILLNKNGGPKVASARAGRLRTFEF